MQTKKDIFERIGLDLDERFMGTIIEVEEKQAGGLGTHRDSCQV